MLAKTLRLGLAAAALVAVTAPGVASAGNGCTLYFTDEEVAAGIYVRVPHCAW